MSNSNATTIMIADLSVEQGKHDEFDKFYHNFYNPELLRVVPDVVTARRYAQTEGFLDDDVSKGHFLTVYELSNDQATDSIEKAIGGAAHKEALEQLKVWQGNGLTYFDQAFYKLVCRHGRLPKFDPWHNHSIYILRWIEKENAPVASEEFHWVEYFNREMFKVPKWLSCRTYMRINSSPPAYMTVFEAEDQASIIEAVTGAGEDLDEDEQRAFAEWLQRGVDWHDCLMLEPIYFLSKDGVKA